jgi:hypothetical protein
MVEQRLFAGMHYQALCHKVIGEEHVLFDQAI